MAYSNAWSNTIPPGTAPANTIDTIIQQLRLDISQRMNTILGSGTDWNSADPVVNGTTNNDLTALTTLVNSKTTLSGLTSGQLLVATGGSSIGNLGIPGSILTAATTTVTSTAISPVFSIAVADGTYIVTFAADSFTVTGTVQLYLDDTGSFGTQTVSTTLPSTANSGSLTSIIVVDGANIRAQVTGVSAGSFRLIYRRIA